MSDNDQQNQQATGNPLSEIAKILKEANNILIIISRDPSIDQLSASIGLTLALNSDKKHATAVFSGKVPPIIEFLEPDKTLEKNTDSLRDFIISLDKSKADKLRYKVEDSVVKIFITPYKTSISEEDLEFSQGDFNVDAVVALGVQSKGDLDEAIVAHGRILHDATIVSISNKEASELGSVHWVESSASSLSEMTADLVAEIDKKLIDSQNATAFLTGIVYETDRFRNEKSSPHTMSVSGILMEAGASTQLISSKLEEPTANEIDESGSEQEIPSVVDDEHATPEKPKPKEPGLIEIEHEENDIHIDDTGKLRKISEVIEGDQQDQPQVPLNNEPNPVTGQPPIVGGSSMVYEPPRFGGQLTANTSQTDQQYASVPDPSLTAQPNVGATLSRSADSAQTLSQLEQSVNSPHVMDYQPSNEPFVKSRTIQPLTAQNSVAQPEMVTDDQVNVEYAQAAVERAITGSTDYKPEPVQALNAQPLGDSLHQNEPNVVSPDNSQNGSTPPPPVPPPMVPMS